MPDLEISEPDFGVDDGEREDMVDERFGSPRLGRYAKYLLLLFFHAPNNEPTRTTRLGLTA